MQAPAELSQNTLDTCTTLIVAMASGSKAVGFEAGTAVSMITVVGQIFAGSSHSTESAASSDRRLNEASTLSNQTHLSQPAAPPSTPSYLAIKAQAAARAKLLLATTDSIAATVGDALVEGG